MRARLSLTAIVFGIRHLLGASFWTPPRHRGTLDRWPEEATASDEDLREILRCWSAQQAVAWTLARLLAWTALVRAVFLLWL